jgi:hypothetical protein
VPKEARIVRESIKAVKHIIEFDLFLFFIISQPVLSINQLRLNGDFSKWFLSQSGSNHLKKLLSID